MKWLVVLVLIYMFWVDYLMAIWPPQNSFCSSPARVAGRRKISIGPQKKEHFNMKAMELSPVIMYSKCIFNSAKLSRVRRDLVDSRSTFTSIDLIKLSCITQTSTKCRFDGTCYANVAVVILIYISARKLRKVVGKHPAAGKTHRGSQHGVLFYWHLLTKLRLVWKSSKHGLAKNASLEQAGVPWCSMLFEPRLRMLWYNGCVIGIPMMNSNSR